MPINFYRLKLLNAILIFASKTKNVNLTKLLKLLYFLDFTHFKETGYPAINLMYYAWDHGPVPRDFYEEVKGHEVPEDFTNKLAIIPSGRWEEKYPEREEYFFIPIAKPDISIFTPRELGIIELLCDMYRDATASQMKEITHLPNEPWDTTKKTKGLYKYVDYLLCLEDTSRESMDRARDTLIEHFEMLNNFGLVPSKEK